MELGPFRWEPDMAEKMHEEPGGPGEATCWAGLRDKSDVSHAE